MFVVAICDNLGLVSTKRRNRPAKPNLLYIEILSSYAISGAISTPSLVEISIQIVGNEGWSAEERTSSAMMKSKTGEGALKQSGCSLRLEECVLKEW
jgi:hypothetical protein